MDISKYTNDELREEIRKCQQKLNAALQCDKRRADVKRDILWYKNIILCDKAELKWRGESEVQNCRIHNNLTRKYQDAELVQ